MPTGVVKFFNTKLGYGFVAPNQGGDDLFVHQNNINMEGFRSLADGEAVEFQIEQDPSSGKAKAVNVTGPKGAPPKGAQRFQSKGKGKGQYGTCFQILKKILESNIQKHVFNTY